MRTIVNWIKQVKLAETGAFKDLQQLVEVADAPEIPAHSAALIPSDLLEKIRALNYLGAYSRQLPLSKLNEVMTTAHFSAYFADALSRAFLDMYQARPGSWQNYVRRDTAPDFRDVKRLRMSRAGKLQKRLRKERSLRTFRRIEKNIAMGVDVFDESFDMDWVLLLNDDLGQIRETPQAMVTAALEWKDEFVSDLYDNSVVQGTLTGLGPVFAGTGRLTTANLAAGLQAMRSRVDPTTGKKLVFRRIHLVIPPELEMDAAKILENLIQYGGTDGNVLRSFVASIQIDPYIGTAGANIPWYLIADPAELPVVTLLELQGQNGPVVSRRLPDREIITGTPPAAFAAGSFATGDIEFEVMDIAGGWDDASFAGVTDHLGIYYSSGTTA